MSMFIKHIIAQIIFPVPHFSEVPTRMRAVFISAPVLRDGAHTVPSMSAVNSSLFISVEL